MRTRLLLFFCGILIFSACRKNYSSPSDENGDDKTVVVDTSFLDSTFVLNKVLTGTGTEYKEERLEGKQTPAIFLDFTDSVTLETITPDISDYYSQVNYVKLKHPGFPKSFFLRDVRAGIIYKGGWMTSMHGLNSTVYLTTSGIIAGDYFFGFHFYDRNGDFKYTIAQTKPVPEFQAWLNVIKVDYCESRELLTGFSVLEDNCLIAVENGDKNILSFFNVPRQNFYLTRPAVKTNSQTHLLSPDTYVEYCYDPLDETKNNFMESFYMKGNSLCCFSNYNSPVQKQPIRHQNPERPCFYCYDGVLTVRQPYNDTIFRIVPPNCLVPEFVTFFGDKKCDVETALYGDKTGKMIRNTWFETSDFVFISFTENYDSKNNRDDHAVKYFYRWYGKGEKRLYQIESESYPEECWIRNSIPDGIPLLTADAKYIEKQLYAAYSKSQLKNMMEHKHFSKLSIKEQQSVIKRYKDLKEGELLVMIVK